MAVSINELPGVVYDAFSALEERNPDAALEFLQWIAEVVCEVEWIWPIEDAKSEPIDGELMRGVA